MPKSKAKNKTASSSAALSNAAAPAGQSAATRRLNENADARNRVSESDLFTHLKNRLRKVTIDAQTFYVAEGDTLMDEDQLGIYAVNRQSLEDAQRAAALADSAGLGTERLMQTRGLIAIKQNGKIVRWKPDTVLTYRVVKNTFPDENNYDFVVQQMAAATRDWQATCGVAFKHMPELDDRNGVQPEGALFSVREIDAGGNFIASAFFPNDPKDRRRMLIDPSYYTTSFDKVGVLRHELGHVLGFRHEHIHKNAPPVCPHEDDWETEYLTQYDPQSVMHYFCGNVGTRDLRITDLDRTGARQVYGPPLNSINFV
jgi:hypothetical protein